ncbi:hypothetical protein [Mesorhizobium sp. M7A.F.Ca.US.010.02.1.1]|uniref:hypothetical protein n=1 Tax=Mesorhizobium sp. M7A.F.Ca.US.010.02.1.1 TaxID=2496743 RepID=UPI0013E2A8A1|nr:hypothetical protein [Mesorhizobium sp. M7A.F.Ca.US.010.02.1.1]
MKLRVVEKGSGLPLLLLHGNGSVAEDFAISGMLDLASCQQQLQYRLGQRGR